MKTCSNKKYEELLKITSCRDLRTIVNKRKGEIGYNEIYKEIPIDRYLSAGESQQHMREWKTKQPITNKLWDEHKLKGKLSIGRFMSGQAKPFNREIEGDAKKITKYYCSIEEFYEKEEEIMEKLRTQKCQIIVSCVVTCCSKRYFTVGCAILLTNRNNEINVGLWKWLCGGKELFLNTIIFLLDLLWNQFSSGIYVANDECRNRYINLAAHFCKLDLLDAFGITEP